jgi:2-polyprenyl-3-methyl-5-hydroxy-6-metoxy-1,4-benzoquinol methylase
MLSTVDIELSDANAMSETAARQCPLCMASPAIVGKANYYDAAKRYSTPVFYCKICEIYGRAVSPAQVRSHIPATSYVQPQSESKWHQARAGFFEYILNVANRHLAKSDRQLLLADFGSAYGHLLDIAARRGFKSTGIEVSPRLVEITRSRGLSVVESIEEVQGDLDVVTLIDSLYLIQNPVALMSKIGERLREGGIAIIRITNRNWIAGMKTMFDKDPDLSVLGDAIFSYSLHGLEKLLSQSGMKVVRVIPDGGAGKKAKWTKALGYKALSAISRLSAHSLLVSPGLIVVATRSFTSLKDRAAQQAVPTC